MNGMIKTSLALLMLAGSQASAVDMKPPSAKSMPSPGIVSYKSFFIGQVFTGYYGGVGLTATGTIANFAEGFPFELRLGLGYNRVDAGDPLLARKVFINNNANGTPTKTATVWDERLDVLYPIKLFSLTRTMFFAGPRHSNFDAHFEYIGGAETFDVVDDQWGMGAGVETSFALSPRVDMVLTGGADYFFPAELSGHDTYYRPNNVNIHPIDNYTYKDAEAAINQPGVMTRLMAGIAYHF